MSLSNFTFKKNLLLKTSDSLYKRDMRKKIIKSSFPTIKSNRIYKAEEGSIISLADNDYSTLKNPINFAKYEYSSPATPSLNYDNGLMDYVGSDESFLNTNTSPVQSTDKKPFSLDLPYAKQTDDYLPLESLLTKYGIKYKLSRGYQKGALTNQGKVSNHSRLDDHGNAMAIDILPEEGDNFNNLLNNILANKNVVNYLVKHNIGILDEFTPDMAKYSRGRNIHIGPDSIALSRLQHLIATRSAKNGMKFDMGGSFAEYTPSDIPEPSLPLDEDIYQDIPQQDIEDKLPYNTLPEEEPNVIDEMVKYYNSKQSKSSMMNTSSTRIPNDSISDFYRTLKPILLEVLHKRNLPTDNVDDMVAQLGLETGWGNTVNGTFNLGNIKAINNKILTQAAAKNNVRPNSTKYVNYYDLYDFANNYISLLSNKRYSNPFVGKFATKLKVGGYAEDPKYISSVESAKRTMLKNI